MSVWWFPALFVPDGICSDCTSMKSLAMFLFLNHFVSHTNMHMEVGHHVLVVMVVPLVIVSRADFLPAVNILWIWLHILQFIYSVIMRKF